MRFGFTIMFVFFLPLIFSTKSHGLDCPDLRIIPVFHANQLVIEGIVSTGEPNPGTGRRNRIKGFLSKPAGGATLELRVFGASQTINTDDQGLFVATISRLIPEGKVILFDPAEKQIIAQKEFSFPSSPSYLLISDIDDTIMISEISKKVRLVLRAIFRKVEDRKVVPGTPELYRDLASSASKIGYPLVFYLSASPSTLSRFLEAFISTKKFPQGTLCLKRSLQTEGFLPREHKIKWLKKISSLNPGLPMLCFGDSGESDPEIYAEFFESGISKSSGVVIRLLENEKVDNQRWKDIETRLKKIGIPFYPWITPDELRLKLKTAGILEK